MAKVSVGLRGWRFDEDELFTADGEWKDLAEIPEDPRHRLVRLHVLVEKPCDACYLEHGEERKERCREASIVYGEPLDEVVLCDAHEADFLYWFRECGGRTIAGDEGFRDAFHEWYADGARAPDGYGGLDHVETEPDELPDLPDAEEVQERMEEAHDHEKRRVSLREFTDDDDGEALREEDLDDVDLGADYPTR